MKKLALGLGLLCLSGCLQTRSELSDAEEKKVTQVSAIQRQHADESAQLENLETQIRTQNGKIETLEHHENMFAKANDENAQKVTALETRVKALEEGILQLSQELETLKATPAPTIGKKEKGEKEKGPFEEGEEHFSQKEWKKAIAAFQKYRETTPKGENIAAATYKIGVSFQELKMNKEAKVFLEEVIERFPKSKSARSASFRLNQSKKK